MNFAHERRGLRMLAPALAVMAALAAAGCSRSVADAGVETRWRAQGFEATPGVTRSEDVLAALGPPSQIIPLGNRIAYYYLAERFTSDRLLLIVYNTTDRRTQYDRAMFVFGPEGVLEAVSYSDTVLAPR